MLVDGAQNGQSALETSDPESNFWKVLDQRMSAAGVTAKQVQPIWMFQVVVTPNRSFPLDVRRLQALMVDTLRVAHQRFPNLRIAYLSSRTYGGYTEVGGSPEPWAYETGFSVKWVVADQVAGKPDLNYDPALGAVRSPWIAWGPYLWTDGVKGCQDGFAYLREDLREDGLHPSEKGAAMIAALMLNFFPAA